MLIGEKYRNAKNNPITTILTLVPMILEENYWFLLMMTMSTETKTIPKNRSG